MVNIFLFFGIFIAIFIVCFWVYYKNYNKLVRYHKFSLTVDVLVFIGATISIVTFFLYYDAIPKYNYLLWGQVIFAISSLNIHITRFFIGITKKRLDSIIDDTVKTLH